MQKLFRRLVTQLYPHARQPVPLTTLKFRPLNCTALKMFAIFLIFRPNESIHIIPTEEFRHMDGQFQNGRAIL